MQVSGKTCWEKKKLHNFICVFLRENAPNGVPTMNCHMLSRLSYCWRRTNLWWSIIFICESITVKVKSIRMRSDREIVRNWSDHFISSDQIRSSDPNVPFTCLKYIKPMQYVKIRNTQSSVGQVLQVFNLSNCHFYSSQTSEISNPVFRSNSNFDQNLDCSGELKCAPPITTKFSRHDIVTFVTCAKFCHQLNTLWTRALQSFTGFRIQVNIVSGWAWASIQYKDDILPV